MHRVTKGEKVYHEIFHDISVDCSTVCLSSIAFSFYSRLKLLFAYELPADMNA